MTRLRAATAIWAASSLAACSSPNTVLPGQQAEVHVIINHAHSPDPTALSGQPLGSFEVELRSDTPSQEASETIAWSGGTAVTSPETLSDFHAASSVRTFVAAEGLQGTVLAIGRGLPFALAEQGAADAHVVLAVPEQLSGLLTSPPPASLRSQGAAVPLGQGLVLLVGGQSGGVLLGPAIYDHSQGTVTPLDGGGPLVRLPAVTALDGGAALVAGGIGPDGGLSEAVWIYQASGFTELPVGLPTAVAGAVAAAFPDGQVVIAGGYTGHGPGPLAATGAITVIDTTASPVVVASSPTELSVPRGEPAVTPLQGVEAAFLVSGGLAFSTLDGGALASADLLQEGSGLNQITVAAVPGMTSSAASALQVGRYHHLAAPLVQGNVLLAGGLTEAGPMTTPNAFAYIYARGTSGQIVPVLPGSGLLASVTGGTAVVLTDGRTLLSGGWGGTAGASGAGTLTLAGDPTTDAMITATFSSIPGNGQGGGSLALMDDQSVVALGGTTAFDATGTETATVGPQIFVPCIDADHPTCLIGMPP